MYNKSIIMKNAWKIKRKKNISMSEALKNSWKNEKEKIINKSFANVILKLEKTINYFSFQINKKCGLDYDDAKQEILLKIYKTLNNYDEKKSSLNTFFYLVIKRESINIIRKEFKNKSLDLEFFQIEDIKNYYSEVEIKEYLESFKNKLDNRSIKVFNKLSLGWKIKDIAEYINVTPNNVYNIIKRKIKPLMNKKLLLNF